MVRSTEETSGRGRKGKRKGDGRKYVELPESDCIDLNGAKCVINGNTLVGVDAGLQKGREEWYINENSFRLGRWEQGGGRAVCSSIPSIPQSTYGGAALLLGVFAVFTKQRGKKERKKTKKINCELRNEKKEDSTRQQWQAGCSCHSKRRLLTD